MKRFLSALLVSAVAVVCLTGASRFLVRVGSGGVVPSINSHPSNQTAAEGGTATFTAVVSGTPSPTCQWERNTGGGYSSIGGATSCTSYTTPTTVLADDGDLFRVVATNASGTATSNAATLTVNAAGTVVAAISATQTSCPAPCGVVFDATGTTRTGWDAATVFRRITYTFNYGKAAVYSPGTYAYGNSTNNSKDADVGGPIGATVFEQPGTYTVQVTANDGTNSDSETVTITVTDPDTVYSGTNTICVSLVSNWTGCPAGASQVTATVTAPAAGKRYLYHVGETFTGTVIIPRNSTTGNDIRIGSYGTGSRPSVRVQINTNNTPSPGLTWARNISLYGLHFPAQLIQYGSTENLLIYNSTVVGTGSTNAAILLGEAITFWTRNGTGGTTGADYYWPRGVVVAEIEVQQGDDTVICGIFAEGLRRSAIIGSLHRGNLREHNIRVTYSNRTIYAHNTAWNPGTDGRHKFKLHAHGSITTDPATLTGWVQSNHATKPASMYSVVANNAFGLSTDGNAFDLDVQPQNNCAVGTPGCTSDTDEGMADWMIENNVFTDNAGTISNMRFAGLRLTYIGNTKSGGGAATADTSVNDTGLPPGFGESYYTSRSTP